MATYLANPDYQSYQFTPYQPPHQETLAAIQAKTQYWMQGASRIKSSFDNIISKEYSHDISKAKINQFRNEVEPQLENIVKKDVSIGTYQKQALGLMTPITRDEGLLIDEATTTAYNNVLKSAQQDATKNGGKYYNTYSVQYASQMIQRYKNSETNADKQYYDVIQGTGYQPYDSKSADNIHNRVKTLMEQTITTDVPIEGGRLQRVTKPRYSVSEALAILEETASPQERSLIQLMGKTQFNDVQLSAQNNPEELARVGQLYKSQFDAEFNDKIAWKMNAKLETEAELAKLNDADPLKKQKKEYLESTISTLETSINELKVQKDLVKLEHFADPANWKIGEGYAAALYNTQHYRNLAVGMGQQNLGSKIVKDDAYWEAARLQQNTINAKTKAYEKQQEAERKALEDIQLPVVTNLTTDSYNNKDEAVKDVKKILANIGKNENKQFTKTLLGSLDISPVDENNIRKDLFSIMETVTGSTKLSDILTGISAEGKQNLERLLKATATAGVPVDIEQLTVEQTQSLLSTYLDPKNKEAFLATARDAGFNNGSIDMIASLYNQKNEIDNTVNRTKEEYSTVYRNTFSKFIPSGMKLTADELFKFETPEVLSKVLEPQLNVLSKQFNLNSEQKNLVVDYIRGVEGADIKLQNSLPNLVTGQETRYYPVFGGNMSGTSGGNYESKSPAFGIITELKNNFENARTQLESNLKNKIDSNQGKLGFNVIQKTYNIVEKFEGSETAAKYMLLQDLKNFVNIGQGTLEDGSSVEGNAKKFEFIRRNLTNGILSFATQTSFRNAAGSKPWMEITFDMAKLRKAIKDDGILQDDPFIGDSDLDKMMEKPAKIFFSDPAQVESKIGGVSDEIEQFTTATPKNYDLVSGNKLQVVNTGTGNIDIHFSGKMMRYEPLTDGTLKIGEIEVSKKDGYEAVSNAVVKNPATSFNALRIRTPQSPEIKQLTQALSLHDARATILKQEIETNGKEYIKQQNGEIVVSLPEIEKGNPSLYKKLINIMKNGRY